MPCRRFIAVGLWSLVLLLPHSAAAQDAYELYAATTGVKSTATLTGDRLDVFSNGVIYRYNRDRRFDAPGADGYYNVVLKQVIRWPHSNQGGLAIGTETPTGMRYRPSEMQIVGGPPARRPVRRARRQPQQAVVIESALPGGGLVSARFGGRGSRGNIEIGDPDPLAIRNQFYLQPEGNGYVTIVPAAKPDMVIDIFNSNAAPRVNVDMWTAANVNPDAAQFRLVPADKGYFFIETKLRPGIVWDVDGAVAAAGANVRLMRNRGGVSQMFRVSDPRDLQAGAFGSRPPLGGVLVVPAPAPLRPARVKFANTQNNELWVVLIDRRAPDRPQQLKISPNAASTVTLSRDADVPPQVLYEVSVYELIRQSVVIDATARGRGKVTDENFSPRSVGWFEIPPGRGQSDGSIDVYRLARRGGNPGRVARIDVGDWADVAPGEVPPPAIADVDTDVEAADDDPDSPFRVAVQSPGQPADDGLSPHLQPAPQGDRLSMPPEPVQLGLVRHNPGSDFRVRRMQWDAEAADYDVTIPVVKKVQVDGETKNVTEYRTETRTRLQMALKQVVVSLQYDQLQAFLPDGRQLDEATTVQALSAETPAVLLRLGEQLDSRYLPLLQPTTPIIVYDNLANQSPSESLDEEQRQLFPATPIDFRSATRTADGGLQLFAVYPEQREVTEEIQVPVVESRVVEGKAVDVTVVRTETITKSVVEWRQSSSTIPVDALRVYAMAGKRIAAVDADARFALPQLVVYVAPGQIVDPWYRKVVRPNVLVIAERPASGTGKP